MVHSWFGRAPDETDAEQPDDAANHAKYAVTLDTPSAFHRLAEKSTLVGQVKDKISTAFGGLLR